MYGKCASLNSGRKLFDEMSERNVGVWNAMISLYAGCKNVGTAIQLFEVMDVKPNASTFNSIMSGLSELDGGCTKALAFYRRMREFGVKPSCVTVLGLLRVFVGVGALNSVKEIHGSSIRNGIDLHLQLTSGLIEVYGRCGCLRNVRVQSDGIAFLGVLKAWSHAGLADEALKYFGQMQIYGVEPRSEQCACLVDALSRSGRLREAYKVIKEMPVKATATAWGALLGGCRNGEEVELAELAANSLFELEPNNVVNYVLLASIYAGVGRFAEADRVRKKMMERNLESDNMRKFDEMQSGHRVNPTRSPSVVKVSSSVEEGTSNGVQKTKSHKKVKRNDEIRFFAPIDGDVESVGEVRMKFDALRRRKRIGAVPGIEIGDIVIFIIEMCFVGLHVPSMAGIDYMSFKFDREEEPVAVSVVLVWRV
ncbi:hypothetical protein IFM89_027039 [Coptis chinensis]|uniref:YDG domain-containing protein n=1 Tax=Coptis chinensis TaxID=261450 RepID=A0A835LP95_9MAGN|nr:hypothetical protein IFM89_027039 [Coptis chinensis]